jgi:hypothetical protein
MATVPIKPWMRISGRQTRPMTVRIYKNGTARISADCVIPRWTTVIITVDTTRKAIEFAFQVGPHGGHKLWFSNKKAKSPMVSLKSALACLHSSSAEFAGEYSLKEVRGTTNGFRFSLKKK